jgi:hypothetical protein
MGICEGANGIVIEESMLSIGDGIDDAGAAAGADAE